MSEEGEKRPTNAIFIGKKPLMSYALAALLQFNAGHNEVIIKARGRAISKAVDVAEIIRRRLFTDKVDISDVRIGTEIIGEDMRNVSTIEIVLGRK
ncbi:MAG: DNA-binding protein Alba [Candidatus Geothermarchaeales archaeon]